MCKAKINHNDHNENTAPLVKNLAAVIYIKFFVIFMGFKFFPLTALYFRCDRCG
jgi:hypothetical protein